MESIRIPFKNDDFGNPIYARISWSNDSRQSKPIALIYHGGGLMVGSSEIIPKPQINYLANKGGFAVVAPNYRLAPQVTAKEAFADCEEAYHWAVTTLPSMMKLQHGLELDNTKVASMGHSSGGTIALHLASCKPLKAVAAFYPSLYNADTSTSAHKPTSAPPFGAMPDFIPSDEEWESVAPANRQISEAGLAIPGSVPAPRNKWQMHILKNGLWPSKVAPEGDFATLDPLTRLHKDWSPIMIVQGEADNVPGSSLELAKRAEKDIKAAGVSEVKLVIVRDEAHMFDLPPTVGTSDLGPKWQAVIEGLDWLCGHVE